MSKNTFLLGGESVDEDFTKEVSKLATEEPAKTKYVRFFCCAAMSFEVCLEMYVWGDKTPGLLRFFTIWGMFMTFFTSICGALMYTKQGEKFKKAYVILFELAISFSIAISIGFWCFLVPGAIDVAS